MSRRETINGGFSRQCNDCGEYFEPVSVDGRGYTKYCEDCLDKKLKQQKESSKWTKYHIYFFLFVAMLFTYICGMIIFNIATTDEDQISRIEVEDGTVCYIYKNMLSCNHGRYNAFTNCGKYPYAIDEELKEEE